MRAQIPEPTIVAQPKQGVPRAVWIVAGVAILLIAAGVGLGVGFGLPSRSKSSSSSSQSPSTPTSSRTNGTTTAPASGTTPSPSNGSTYIPAGTPPAAGNSTLDPLNTTELPLAALDQFVAELNQTAMETQDPDWLTLVELIEDNRHMFLLFLRARKLDDVIAYLEATREDADGYTLADQEAAGAALLDTVTSDSFQEFATWLQGSNRKVPPLTPKQIEELQDLEPAIDSAIIAKYGNDTSNTTSGPDLRDPVVQLSRFSDRLAAANLDFTNLLDPAFYTLVEKGRAGPGGRKMKAVADLPPLGYSWFKPSRIGLVFHALQYDNGTALFPGSSPRLRTAFQNLVDAANRFYTLSGVNVQFYVQEVRMDATKHPYLLQGTLTDWQDCAAQRQECLCLLARDQNVGASNTYVNIYVSGFLYLMTQEAVLAYSSSLPPLLDICGPTLSSTTTAVFQDDVQDPRTLSYNNQTTPEAQHVWMAFDNLVLQTAYNRSLYDDGGATLAHELGHFLGLMHTHDNGCVATDFVADTAPNLLIDQQPWAYTALAPWCRALRAGRPVNNKALAGFDSCPKDDSYMDNVFNLMSYTPSPCSLFFTPGQVQRIQRISTVYRAEMLQPV